MDAVKLQDRKWALVCLLGEIDVQTRPRVVKLKHRGNRKRVRQSRTITLRTYGFVKADGSEDLGDMKMVREQAKIFPTRKAAREWYEQVTKDLLVDAALTGSASLQKV